MLSTEAGSVAELCAKMEPVRFKEAHRLVHCSAPADVMGRHRRSGALVASACDVDFLRGALPPGVRALDATACCRVLHLSN